MPWVVKECGRRGATGGFSFSFVTEVLGQKRIAAALYREERANCQMGQSLKYPRHCEPTGRANARPMTGSAKQSISELAEAWIASSLTLLAMKKKGEAELPCIRAEQGNAVHRQHHGKGDHQHGDAEHGDR